MNVHSLSNPFMRGSDSATQLSDFHSSFEMSFSWRANAGQSEQDVRAAINVRKTDLGTVSVLFGSAGLYPARAGILLACLATIRISSPKLPAQSAKQPEPVALRGRTQRTDPGSVGR